jgi:hypothetical protein
MVVRALSSLAMSVTFFWYTGVATLADGDWLLQWLRTCI